MSVYAAVESIVVAMLALVSVYYVLKVFAPGLLRNLRVRIADWLSRPAHGSPLNVLADQVTCRRSVQRLRHRLREWLQRLRYRYPRPVPAG